MLKTEGGREGGREEAGKEERGKTHFVRPLGGEEGGKAEEEGREGEGKGRIRVFDSVGVWKVWPWLSPSHLLCAILKGRKNINQGRKRSEPMLHSYQKPQKEGILTLTRKHIMLGTTRRGSTKDNEK